MPRIIFGAMPVTSRQARASLARYFAPPQAKKHARAGRQLPHMGRRLCRRPRALFDAMMPDIAARPLPLGSQRAGQLACISASVISRWRDFDEIRLSFPRRSLARSRAFDGRFSARALAVQSCCTLPLLGQRRFLSSTYTPHRCRRRPRSRRAIPRDAPDRDDGHGGQPLGCRWPIFLSYIHAGRAAANTGSAGRARR